MHRNAGTVPNPDSPAAEDEEEFAVSTVDGDVVDIAVDILVDTVVYTVVVGYDTTATPATRALDTMVIRLLHTVIHGRHRILSKPEAVIPRAIRPICTRLYLVCLQVNLSPHRTMDRVMAPWLS